MAKVKSITPMIGTLGGINFYLRKGVPVSRVAGGGFTRKAIKTSPTMQRVREQNTEFANCSATNKVFKQAMRPALEGYVDGTLHSRLQAFFLKVKTLDSVNERGQRTVANGIATPFGRKLLTDFTFTPKRATLLPAQLSFDWGSYTLDVSNFGIQWVKFPQQADLLQVRLYVVKMDFTSLRYTLTESPPETLSRAYASNSFSLTAPAPTGSGLEFAVVRVAFYQEVNGRSYLLPGEGFLGVKVVSVKPD